jgi:hypothetical protein|tara:strand:+ start:64 stop:291 length:228 start_codon:yes stop_codon:yes gene_type:complete
MKKQLVKYITALLGIIFLSVSDIGEGSYIMVGPFTLNPKVVVKPIKEKVIEPMEDMYKDIKKVVTMKKKKKKWYE